MTLDHSPSPWRALFAALVALTGASALAQAPGSALATKPVPAQGVTLPPIAQPAVALPSAVIAAPRTTAPPAHVTAQPTAVAQQGNAMRPPMQVPGNRPCPRGKPDPGYAGSKPAVWGPPSGVPDFPKVLNTVNTHGWSLAHNLEDMQVRIEQLRCENANLADKLDHLIRLQTRN